MYSSLKRKQAELTSPEYGKANVEIELIIESVVTAHNHLCLIAKRLKLSETNETRPLVFVEAHNALLGMSER